LDELAAAFSEWRSKKRHRRDRTPEDLVKRARAAALVHGSGAVARALKIDYRHLAGGTEPTGNPGVTPSPTPMYSRLELSAPGATSHPVAELEMPNGIKLRMYTQTHEMLSLLSSLFVARGER
jgi:hypothetical protein